MEKLKKFGSEKTATTVLSNFCFKFKILEILSENLKNIPDLDVLKINLNWTPPLGIHIKVRL